MITLYETFAPPKTTHNQGHVSPRAFSIPQSIFSAVCASEYPQRPHMPVANQTRGEDLTPGPDMPSAQHTCSITESGHECNPHAGSQGTRTRPGQLFWTAGPLNPISPALCLLSQAPGCQTNGIGWRHSLISIFLSLSFPYAENACPHR